jgi:ABC-type glycerol-3-phosphate transport system permease component
VIRHPLRRLALYPPMVLVAVFALFPVYWVVITSLKTRAEIFSKTPVLWPSHPNWHIYSYVLGSAGIGRALLNSLIVASATMALCLVIGSMAAYALTRFHIPLRRVLLMLVLFVQMFPLIVLVIPLFIIERQAGLLGTYSGLVLAYLAFTVPLAIWVMRSFLLGIPEELEHAARLDGATRLGAFVRVVLPLAAPGLATTAVLCFLEGWKEFMLALTFLNQQNRMTLPVVLQSFIGRGDVDWASVMATSVIYTLPVIVLFMLLRRHLMTARLTGAVKG